MTPRKPKRATLCQRCGQTIPAGKISLALYCSARCSLIVRKTAWRAREKEKRLAELASRRCKICAGPIPLGKNADTVYCSRRCQRTTPDAHARALRDAARDPRVCVACSASITPARKGGAVYCSDRCRDTTHKRRVNNRLLAERRTQRESRPTRFCAHCTGQIPTHRRRDAIYCTEDCSRKASGVRSRRDRPHVRADCNQRRRARAAGSDHISRVDRLAIIARDKSICHICRKRVAKKDITIDHLIPLALGGDHAPTNLAVAHRTCNSRKWIHAKNEQLRLVG